MVFEYVSVCHSSNSQKCYETLFQPLVYCKFVFRSLELLVFRCWLFLQKAPSSMFDRDLKRVSSSILGLELTGQPTHREKFLFQLILNSMFQTPEITCENQATCFKIPKGCTSSKDCNLLVNYKHNMANSAFNITIASKEEWGAFSQVPDIKADKMVSME